MIDHLYFIPQLRVVTSTTYHSSLNFSVHR